MAVTNGQLANQTTFNNAFMSRTAATTNTVAATTFSNTTQSTDKDTGAIVTEGGLGVEKNINAGGTIKNADTTQSTDKDTGAIVTEGGLGVEKNANIGGNLNTVGNITATGAVLGSNLSGTNTGDITLSAIGSSPNANGATLTGQQLNLQPASASFGGVVTAGAQTIAGDKTFADDVVISGDLTVNGTTTTINTATLEVEDQNILVNNGGNDASAEGAGLTVERTATNGSLVYENALASKWKCGAAASESEIMTVGTAQTISGVKTFSATPLLKTAIDIEDPGAGTNKITIQAPTLAGDYTLTLPTTDGAANEFLQTDGNGVLTWAAASGGSTTAPTVQKFTTGTAQIYTTPANVVYIRVRMVGGGGGGGAGGSSGGSAASAGGSSLWKTADGITTLLTAGGGSAGVLQGGSGAAGGTATIGTGPYGTALSGGAGGGTGYLQASTGGQGGGIGGSSFFGGAGAGSAAGNTAGGTGATNTGGGGGGGGSTFQAGANAIPGSGGGGGGFIDCFIDSPAASYEYTVGAAGTGGGAGSNGGAGGNGAAGYIEVTEYY